MGASRAGDSARDDPLLPLGDAPSFGNVANDRFRVIGSGVPPVNGAVCPAVSACADSDAALEDWRRCKPEGRASSVNVVGADAGRGGVGGVRPMPSFDGEEERLTGTESDGHMRILLSVIANR